ncbi:alpha/beta hydrolase fold domain-containing protein [Pseudonocardia sp. CA-142604]|uniref:alpha/beta hydrolase fold domain-containing protein n=1 Tax=Pseudonocardia sp. CA-142604 TaxID=3240024 RepID=UPI003D8BFBE1
MDDIVADQIGYYRARTDEYDEWWFRRNRYDQGVERNAAWFREVADAEATLVAAGPRGNALEIACGTGLWTRHLAPRVEQLLALDAAEEPMAIARARVNAPNVTYLEADIFSWRPSERYDFIFFGFWISHIPRAQWLGFWKMLADALAPGGSIFFIDNSLHPDGGISTSDHRQSGADEIETRVMNDGRRYTVVKNFFVPHELEAELAALGWRGWVRESPEFFIYGSFTRVSPDPQVLAELAPLLETISGSEPPAAGDVDGCRRYARQVFAYVTEHWTPAEAVGVERHELVVDDGATLALDWYYPPAAEHPGSAALYLHGGGMILGLEHVGELFDLMVRNYVATSGVPMLVVDYRIAPEHPFPTPVEDCYAALNWLAEHAQTLGVDPKRIGVMGDSAGGNLAAAVCLLARDRGGPRVAQQILIHPMLDDRTTTPDPLLLPFLTWTYDDNITGWSALLGNVAGTDAVSQYAAPARATDLTGLPDTYIDVGGLDIFRDEDVEFARKLSDAGVPTELHLRPGCMHAFDVLARGADVSQRAIADRARRLRAL